MKNVITTIVLLLATSQVSANGFYQQVVADAPQADKTGNSVETSVSYTPLYNKVSDSRDRLAAAETHGPNPEFRYTPLYLKVVGPDKPWNTDTRIARR